MCRSWSCGSWMRKRCWPLSSTVTSPICGLSATGWCTVSGDCPNSAGKKTPQIVLLSPQHRRHLFERSDAGIHLHRLVQAVGVRGRVAAPAAFAHDDGGKVEVECLPDTRFHAAIGGAAADQNGIPSQHPQQLRNPRPIERARPALEENIVLGPRRDLIGKPGFFGALDAVGE